MRKPNEVVYGPLDSPSWGVTALNGVQHVALMGIYLVFPVIVAREAGAPPSVAAAMVSLTLVALAIGTVLQAFPLGPLGSGFLVPPTPTVVYLIPSIAAAHHGGLPLVLGMTLIAGVVQLVLARALPRLRPFLPPEVAGLVALLVGIATGLLGLRTVLGPAADAAAAPLGVDVGIALATLSLMVALNVWARGPLRMYCVLIGLVVGSIGAWSAGAVASADLLRVADGPTFAWPDVGHVAFAFDAAFVGPFVLAALLGTIRVLGNVTSCQRATDADWTRPDMVSVARGAMAEGVTTLVAGGIGSIGVSSATGAVGLSTATGVHSRRVAWAIGAILLALAVVPKLGLLFHAMPRPVIGAALVFSSTFIIVNGLQILTSRLLDARRTLVVGLSIVLGLAVDLFPGVVSGMPPSLQPMLGTPLMLGAVVALTLTLLFRIGVRQTHTLSVPVRGIDPSAVRAFMEACGAGWGARRDVIERAAFSLAQAIETIAGSGVVAGPIEVAASFDEFRLDLRISYDGEPLELPEQRPSVDEILASDDGERRLAGYLLRQCADRVGASRRNGHATMVLHFDH